jgi:hypothetical protein
MASNIAAKIFAWPAVVRSSALMAAVRRRGFILGTAHTSQGSFRNAFRLCIRDQQGGFLQQRNAVAQGIGAVEMNLRILGTNSQQSIYKQALGYRRLISFGVNPAPGALTRVGVYERAMFLLEEASVPDSRVMHGYDGGFRKTRSNQLESFQVKVEFMRGIQEAQIDFSIANIFRRKIHLRFPDKREIVATTETAPGNSFGPSGDVVTEHLALRIRSQQKIQGAVPVHKTEFDDGSRAQDAGQSEQKHCLIAVDGADL